MLSYDIPVETVDAVMSVYYGATAAVKSDGDISEYFDLGVGVLQGDTLAPYLFVLVIDWIMWNAVPDASCSRTRWHQISLYLACGIRHRSGLC